MPAYLRIMYSKFRDEVNQGAMGRINNLNHAIAIRRKSRLFRFGYSMMVCDVGSNNVVTSVLDKSIRNKLMLDDGFIEAQ